MWPHFETWRGGLEWARGDTKGGRGGGGVGEGGRGIERVVSFMRAETSFSQPKRRPAATPNLS